MMVDRGGAPAPPIGSAHQEGIAGLAGRAGTLPATERPPHDPTARRAEGDGKTPIRKATASADGRRRSDDVRDIDIRGFVDRTVDRLTTTMKI
jgi:hypothetical protein